jgi:hypothetical protein
MKTLGVRRMRRLRMTETTSRRQAQIIAPNDLIQLPAHYVKSIFRKAKYPIDYDEK